MTHLHSLRDKTRKSLCAAVELLKPGISSDNALFTAGRCSAYSETLFNIDEHINADSTRTHPSTDKQNILVWRCAKAGTKFPSEALVISDSDPDPHLCMCAINDCEYILVKDIINLK